MHAGWLLVDRDPPTLTFACNPISGEDYLSPFDPAHLEKA
jgi:hypothetical protein